MERLTGSRSDKNDSYVALDAPSQATHIPVEILHMIISETDPLLNVHTHLKAFPQRSREALETQKAFSLVCRRWRDVALQYVFSRIHITSSDGVDSHAGFFRDTPWVAEHVIKLTLRAQVSALALDTLLRTLPSLQYLDISNSFVEGSPDADLQVDSSRALRELRYPCPEIGPRLDAQCETIQHLLRLFSAINYLDIGFFAYPSTINVDSVNARIESACSYTRDSDREFRIHNLKASGHTTAGFLVPEYLRRTGALKDLTSLSFFLAKPSLKIVSRMLNAVHMTLETLELSWREWHDGFQNGEYFAGVQECLSDCRMLKDIELRVILPRHEGEYVHLRDGKIHRPATDEQGGWLQLLRALTAVSPDRLRSAKLCLVGLLMDPHVLDWGGLREWCSGVPCLETVEVVLHQAYDQTSCFAYEMQSFERIFRADYHPPRSATVADSPILVGRFIDEDEVKCRHDGCRRYHANEQSSKSQSISGLM